MWYIATVDGTSVFLTHNHAIDTFVDAYIVHVHHIRLLNYH